MARPLDEIIKDLDNAVSDDSFYQAETLDEFDELQAAHYRRIAELIVERNDAEARLEAEKQGIPFVVATVEETARMLLASE